MSSFSSRNSIAPSKLVLQESGICAGWFSCLGERLEGSRYSDNVYVGS